MKFYVRAFQKFAQNLGVVILCVIDKNVNRRFRRVTRNQLFEKLNRRFRINRLRKIDANRACVNIYETVDIEVLTSAIRFQFHVFSAANPAEGGNAVVAGVATVAEVENLVFARFFSEFPVLGHEFRLLLRVRLSGHALRLLIHETQSVQRLTNIVDGERQIVRFLNMPQNVLGLYAQIFVQPSCQFDLLFRIEPRDTSTVMTLR